MYPHQPYLNKISHPMWISSQNQIADILTKVLDETNVLRFRDALLGHSGARC